MLKSIFIEPSHMREHCLMVRTSSVATNFCEVTFRRFSFQFEDPNLLGERFWQQHNMIFLNRNIASVDSSLTLWVLRQSSWSVSLSFSLGFLLASISNLFLILGIFCTYTSIFILLSALFFHFYIHFRLEINFPDRGICVFSCWHLDKTTYGIETPT